MVTDGKKKEVVVVNVNNTNQPNGYWKMSKSRAEKSGVLVTEEHGKVKRVYTFKSVKKYPSGRVTFRGFKRVRDPEVISKYANVDVSRKKGEANPVRYK